MSEPFIDSLVLDAGPLIAGSAAELKQKAREFYTTPAVFNTEIRDEQSRKNLELQWGDLVKVRQPGAAAIKAVSDFSKLTGDYSVLSMNDIHVLALCYELEVEKNGDWRLRKKPGEKIKPPNSGKTEKTEENGKESAEKAEDVRMEHTEHTETTESTEIAEQTDISNTKDEETPAIAELSLSESKQESEDDGWTTVTRSDKKQRNKQRNNQNHKSDLSSEAEPPAPQTDGSYRLANEAEGEAEDDEEGWITPDNLSESIESASQEQVTTKAAFLKAAVCTNDFAMQNVSLQMGLNLISTRGFRISKVRTYMLRCHACFRLLPMTEKRDFCPSCGGNTLMRATVSIDASGDVVVHLKRNMQWYQRGLKYSLPNPQSLKSRRHASNLNGKLRHLDDRTVILSEDQKEYEKKVKEDDYARRKNEKMLNEWISGVADTNSPFAVQGTSRNMVRGSGMRVGRGRYVNSSKRHK